jgi:hypothetical protein
MKIWQTWRTRRTDQVLVFLILTIELLFNDCKLCGVNVKNPCECKKCKSVFHPSCFDRAMQAKNQTCVHEKDVALSFSTNSSDVIMEFLKSNEFQDIVINAVSVETEKLRQQMIELKAEVENLKLSNIGLVRVMHGTPVVTKYNQNNEKKKILTSLMSDIPNSGSKTDRKKESQYNKVNKPRAASTNATAGAESFSNEEGTWELQKKEIT